ncbi:MAG TPA: hemerythrin domain-containing protein [Gemmataceae bacterium]
MKHLDRRGVFKAIAAAAGAAALTGPEANAAGLQDKNKGKGAPLKPPGSLKAEHDELHAELVRATKAGGKTGEAARAVAKVLHPHFVKEEELAMPPLGLLSDLAAGAVRPEMARVLELTDKLKEDLPSMLKEHEAIVAALETLAEAAEQENKPQPRQLAEKLKQHARTEEEVLYPAAILVGEYVRLKLDK